MTADIRWAEGYAAGSIGGTRDRSTEQAGTYRRDPDHRGQLPDLPQPDLEQWVDGFLSGYADLRGAV